MLCSLVVHLKRIEIIISSLVVFNFEIRSKRLCMEKFRVFVYMLIRDASLKQRIPCIICISIFGAFSAGKKCALYKVNTVIKDVS